VKSPLLGIVMVRIRKKELAQTKEPAEHSIED
jgi:hypothetical protein